MRRGLIFAAAFIALSPTSALAEGWCGFAGKAKSMIECGYSSNAECESAIGKDGMCFLDPEYALNRKRSFPAAASRFTAGRG